jgi:DNA-binding CsgD family transcriptional regulator
MQYAKAPKVELPNNHLTFQILPDLKEICRPFFHRTGINHFHYIHYNLNDEKIAVITTAPEGNQYVFKNQYIATGRELDTGLHYLPSFKAGAERAEMGKRFNVDNVLEFVENHGNGIVEMFGFGTHCEAPEMVNYYFNNLEKLHRFNREFCAQADGLIKQVFANPIDVPGHNKIIVDNEKSPRPNGKSFILGQREVRLSVRECQVLKGLLDGLSAKEIALKVNLSNRTVEFYLNNVKNKMGVSKNVELMHLCYKHNILI